jgi:hypothetical protein
VSQNSPINQKLDDTLSALEVVLKIYFSELLARMKPIAFKLIGVFSLWTLSLTLTALLIDALLDNRIEHARWLAAMVVTGIVSSVLLMKTLLKKNPTPLQNDPMQLPVVSHN